MSGDFASAFEKLQRFAAVRDRATDREPRTITLTDDEAFALLVALSGHPDD